MRQLLLVTIIAIVFAGCATSTKSKAPPAAPTTPVYAELLLSAKQDITDKKITRANTKLLRIIKESPGTSASSEAHFLLGQIAYNTGKTQDSISHFNETLNAPASASIEAETQYRLSLSLMRLERFSESLAKIDLALSHSQLPTDLKVPALQTRLQILKKMRAPLEELKTLLHLDAATTDNSQKQEYRLQAMSLVESSLTIEQLEQIATDSKYSFAQAPAQFRVGVAALEKSDFSKAKSYLKSVVKLANETDLGERAQSYLDQIEARESVNPNVVGVILPMTGRLTSISQRTLRGLQLGLGILGDKKSSLELAVVDSGNTSESARRAVERLVTEDRVIAIVGTLSSKTAAAIALKSQEFAVPTIALSQKSGITEIGDYVFRNALTSEMQVRILVTEAIQKRGIKRFGILYPKDAYGQEFANLFWDEVTRQGGEIRAVQYYKAGDTDFNSPIKKLVGLADVKAREWEYKMREAEWKKQNPNAKRKEDHDVLPPIVEFEALFIPDSAKTIGQIAPTLLYNDVKDVLLLGTNLWNTTSLVDRAGKFIKSSLFIDSYLPTDEAFSRSQFYENFQKTFGTTPEDFEIQAYDTGVMIREAIEKSGGSRVQLKSALAALSGVSGALGPLNVNPQREVQRPTVLLTIQDGKISRLE